MLFFFIMQQIVQIGTELCGHYVLLIQDLCVTPCLELPSNDRMLTEQETATKCRTWPICNCW